jgi:beta-xylosidase
MLNRASYRSRYFCGVFALLVFTSPAFAFQTRWVDTFVNPMDASLADPGVMKEGNTYYVYSTGMQLHYSTDLINWRDSLFLYSAPSGDNRYNFWAPEVIKRPSDGRFIMFYTAQSPGQKLKIYAAQSSSPQGSFVDVYGTTPLFDTHVDDAWIDASPFIDTDGQAYMYVTKDIASGSTRPDRGAIFVLPLNLNTVTVGDPVKVLSPATTGWEVRPGGGADIEGAFVIKHGTKYFLFYSCNLYSTANYAVGYAVGDTPYGPFTKYAGNPILTSGVGLYGPGHCSVARSPDNLEYFMFYHSKIISASGAQRQLCIDRFDIVNNVVRMAVRTSSGDQASTTPQLLPSGVVPQAFCPAFEPFNTLNTSTWHFMGENIWHRSVSGGVLSILAGTGDVIGTSTNISNLALAYAAQDQEWQVTAKINNFTAAADGQQTFVTIWKDQQNFVRLSDTYQTSRKFRVIREENGVTAYYEVANTLPATKWLRIRKSGNRMTFHASGDGNTFTELLNGTTNGYTVGWATDRQLQLGLGAVRPGTAPQFTAYFDAVWYDRLTPTQPGFNDEFDGPAFDRTGWIVHNEDLTRYGQESQTLRIRAQDGDWANARTDLRNVFLQSAPGGDWTITTSLQMPAMDANYDQGFLIVASNHNNFIKFGRAFIDGRKLEAGLETVGVWGGNSIPDPWPVSTYVQLRIRKVGTTYHCEASGDGNTWTTVGTKTAAWTPLFFGIGAATPGSAHLHDCHFQFFRVAPGGSDVPEWSSY